MYLRALGGTYSYQFFWMGVRLSRSEIIDSFFVDISLFHQIPLPCIWYLGKQQCILKYEVNELIFVINSNKHMSQAQKSGQQQVTSSEMLTDTNLKELLGWTILCLTTPLRLPISEHLQERTALNSCLATQTQCHVGDNHFQLQECWYIYTEGVGKHLVFNEV